MKKSISSAPVADAQLEPSAVGFPWLGFVVPAAISAAIFALALVVGGADFDRLVACPDTGGYTSIARSLVQEGAFSREAVRTLGYPLYLAGCYLIGGDAYGNHVAIAGQLLLNLTMLPLTWTFLHSLSPTVDRRVALGAALLVWFAGLGFALLLLSDFLAAACFNIFLFGFCFRRTRAGLFFAGFCLFHAVITRPTFTFAFLLIPLLALAVRKFAAPIPWRQVFVYSLFGLAGSLANSAQEYYCQETKGPQIAIKEYPAMVWNATLVLHEHYSSEPSKNDYRRLIAEQTGRPYESLARRERAAANKIVLRDIVLAHPVPFATHVLARLGKSLLAPMDCLAWTIKRLLTGNESPLASAYRIPLGVLCLPLWVLAYIPGRQLIKRQTAYLVFCWILVGYVLGLTALAAEGCGERYRLPVMMALVCIAALQLDYVWQRFIGAAKTDSGRKSVC